MIPDSLKGYICGAERKVKVLGEVQLQACVKSPGHKGYHLWVGHSELEIVKNGV